MGLKEEISIRCNAIISTFSQQEFPRMKKELENDLTQIFDPLKEFIGLMERRLVQKRNKGGRASREKRELRREKAWREENFNIKKEDKIVVKEPSKNWDKEGLWTVNKKYSMRLSDLGLHDDLSRKSRKEKRAREREEED